MANVQVNNTLVPQETGTYFDDSVLDISYPRFIRSGSRMLRVSSHPYGRIDLGRMDKPKVELPEYSKEDFKGMPSRPLVKEILGALSCMDSKQIKDRVRLHLEAV